MSMRQKYQVAIETDQVALSYAVSLEYPKHGSSAVLVDNGVVVAVNPENQTTYIIPLSRVEIIRISPLGDVYFPEDAPEVANES